MYRSKMAAPRVVQKQHPERLLQHRADQIRAPDRDREGDDLRGRRAERRVEDERQPERDRQPEDDHDDLPARELGDVVVERQHRPQEVAVQVALADPVLPVRAPKTMFMFRTRVQTM